VTDIMQSLANIITLLFVLTTMISMGLGLTVRQIIKPLRNIRFLIVALAVNFVIVPLVAYLITLGISLDEPLKAGLILISIAAGAPALPKLAEIAKANIASAVSLMVLLIVVTIAFIPVVLPFILSGIKINAWDIARGLLLQMLLPLALALIVRVFFKDLAKALKAYMTQASSISLLLLIVITIVVNFNGVISLFGSGGLISSLIVILVAFAAGYFLGGPDANNRKVQSLGSSQRNIAGIVVATQNFSNEPDVLVMIVTFSLLTLIIIAPVVVLFGRQEKKAEKSGLGNAVPSGGAK
jgi:BASS family bile acid:Na+ symporter